MTISPVPPSLFDALERASDTAAEELTASPPLTALLDAARAVVDASRTSLTGPDPAFDVEITLT